MYAAWLATVLVGMGVDQVQSQPAPACVIGADEDDVELMLGQPDFQALAGRGPVRSVWHWRWVDWLGARHTRRVTFVLGVAEADFAKYEPFAARPPWVDALRAAFGLLPPPPAWNSVKLPPLS